MVSWAAMPGMRNYAASQIAKEAAETGAQEDYGRFGQGRPVRLSGR